MVFLQLLPRSEINQGSGIKGQQKIILAVTTATTMTVIQKVLDKNVTKQITNSVFELDYKLNHVGGIFVLS